MTLTKEDIIMPNYLNNRLVYANLTVTDCAVAAVLAKLNLMLVGDSGTGKSQLAEDMYSFLFGGNFAEKGKGILVRAHPEIDIYNEIFSELNLSEAKRKLTDNVKAMIYYVDELNRAPEVAQNQFFGLGDGMMDFQGKRFRLGQDGYHVLVATANLGNGEFQGTFDADKALYNRLHVTLDFDHNAYKPTREDKLILRRRKADPNVKAAPQRDISDKIVEASKEITEMTAEPGIDALAILHYLEFGLEHCQKFSGKGKIWPMGCHDCEYNQNSDGSHALCSLVKSPVERTLQSVIKYACALQYVSHLKNKNQPLDAIDLVFKAFELTGAYQQLLNQTVLKTEYFDHNPALMSEVVTMLKNDFRAHEDFIVCGLEKAQEGKKLTDFITQDGKICSADGLSDQAKKKMKVVSPFTNEHRPVGLGWVKDVIDFEIKQKKKVNNPKITDSKKKVTAK